ncbi:MAG: peptidoglycan editing factor PgeF [Gammaproteobacteria bacterium]|nr:peptidoglycan editing factor PgeF [Gammaproteobacteria bacterium]
MDKASYLQVKWPDQCSGKLDNVFAATTLIHGGVSKGDYREFNLATHVGDDPAAVSTNRVKLVEDLALPSEPVWLDQVHSNKVHVAQRGNASADAETHPVQADASVTRVRDVVCAVLTADCLPVFFSNLEGTEVAVAHAGWRGLHDGIISNTLAAMDSSVADVVVSLGPAIGPQAFEVGTDVYDAFLSKNQQNSSAFIATDKIHYLCDIYQLARIELSAAGVSGFSGGGFCTFNDSKRFYSYRRHKNTGRMASLIWFR